MRLQCLHYVGGSPGTQTHPAGTTWVCQPLKWGSVCPTECALASSVSQALPLCCNNIAAGGGVGWVVEVGGGGAVFSKGPAVATLIYDHEP